MKWKITWGGCWLLEMTPHRVAVDSGVTLRFSLLFFFPLLFQESITALYCTTSSPTTPISSPTRLLATCFLMRWVKSCITCRVTHTVGIISAHMALHHTKWVLYEVNLDMVICILRNQTFFFFPIRPSSNSTLRLNLLKIFWPMNLLPERTS